MVAEDRDYRAICFDLDGTLLGMDIDDFMSSYFSRIAKWAAQKGLDPEKFIKALRSGTKAMALNDDDVLNKDVFWAEFKNVYGEDDLEGVDANAIADEFYREEFNHIGDGFVPEPKVAETLKTLKAKGYPLMLTTMPMFPLQAVKHRLGWAGIDPSLFDRITTYENSKVTKPRQTYFAENLAAMNVSGKDVLMVGNNTMEDLAFIDLGADGYLVTDWLLDPVGYDLGSIKHGSFEDFAEWAKDLKACANPVTHVETGPISREDMLKSFEDNILDSVDPSIGDKNSKRLANAIETDVALGKEK